MRKVEVEVEVGGSRIQRLAWPLLRSLGLGLGLTGVLMVAVVCKYWLRVRLGK